MSGLRLILFISFFIFSHSAFAGEWEDVNAILKSNGVVKGVVFEILGGDAVTLRRALIRAKGYTYKLRGKYKDIKIVILTHGLEQFSLRKQEADKNRKLHRQVEKLVKNHNVPVQVCGRFAEMNGVEDNEFLDFVEVLDSSPVQLETYRYEGYRVIEMDIK